MRLLDVRRPLLALAIGALLTNCAAAAPETADCRLIAVANLPGVVTDGGRHSLYATGPDGLLTAFEGSNGSIAWKGEARRTPLALIGERLLTWGRGEASGLMLELGPVGGATKVDRSFRVELPPWTQARDANLAVDSELEGCRLWVHWRAELAYKGGAPPVPGNAETQSQKAEGWVALDPATAEFSAGKAGPPLPTEPRSIPYRQGSQWLTSPLTIGEGMAVLTREKSGAGDKLALVYSGSKRVNLPVSGNDLMVMVTPDHRQVFVTDLARNSAAEATSWTIIDAMSGRPVAEASIPADAIAAELSDGQVHYLREVRSNTPSGQQQQTILVVADARGGSVLWQQVLSSRRQQLLRP